MDLVKYGFNSNSPVMDETVDWDKISRLSGNGYGIRNSVFRSLSVVNNIPCGLKNSNITNGEVANLFSDYMSDFPINLYPNHRPNNTHDTLEEYFSQNGLLLRSFFNLGFNGESIDYEYFGSFFTQKEWKKAFSWNRNYGCSRVKRKDLSDLFLFDLLNRGKFDSKVPQTDVYLRDKIETYLQDVGFIIEEERLSA